MANHAKVDAERLIQALQWDFEQAMRQVAGSVNQAPNGQWIDASEEPVRQAMGRLRRRAYEQALQDRANEAQASFSPSAQRSHREASSK